MSTTQSPATPGASSGKHHAKLLNAAVIVSALGYFVDIYDLILFSIVRIPSLKSLGLPEERMLEDGIFLINMQMFGMLLGGMFWGILGDKRGRLSVLFGSIVLYSVANIANGFVTSIESYAAWRLIAGIGLAGELGAGITLVAEVLPKEKRGWGTTIVASVGICGAVLAAKVAEGGWWGWLHPFLESTGLGILARPGDDWRMAYVFGGVLGLMLLVLRVQVFESGLFSGIKETKVQRGDFFSLFTASARFFKYLRCILIGVPVWFVIGVLITLAPEFAQALGVEGTVTGGNAVMYSYIGLAMGDLASGVLSQLLKSRRRVVAIFLLITLALVFAYLRLHGASASTLYFFCWALGFGVGYWAIFVTIGAEQFGTNLRATVATTVPNFVRGAVVPITIAFKLAKDSMGILPGALVVGLGCLAIAFLSLWKMEETFHKDLDYVEEHGL